MVFLGTGEQYPHEHQNCSGEEQPGKEQLTAQLQLHTAEQ